MTNSKTTQDVWYLRLNSGLVPFYNPNQLTSNQFTLSSALPLLNLHQLLVICTTSKAYITYLILYNLFDCACKENKTDFECI